MLLLYSIEPDWDRMASKSGEGSGRGKRIISYSPRLALPRLVFMAAMATYNRLGDFIYNMNSASSAGGTAAENSSNVPWVSCSFIDLHSSQRSVRSIRIPAK
jgi:hypothetical protein